MNPWLIAMLGYLGLAALTFLPVAAALLRKVELHDGGHGPDQSSLFADAAKARLQQNHSRLLGTLGFWKGQAQLFKRFHFYALGWVIPSSVFAGNGGRSMEVKVTKILQSLGLTFQCIKKGTGK